MVDEQAQKFGFGVIKPEILPPDENQWQGCKVYDSTSCWWAFLRGGTDFLKLINYSSGSYPTRASYSGQVDEFRNPMKNELKTRPCLKPVFENFANFCKFFLICILIRQQKHVAINNYLITHFTKQTLNLNYLLLTLNVAVQFLILNYPKQKNPFFF